MVSLSAILHELHDLVYFFSQFQELYQKKLRYEKLETNAASIQK